MTGSLNTREPDPERARRIAEDGLILRGLVGYNQQRGGPADWRPLAVLLHDDEETLVGGLCGANRSRHGPSAGFAPWRSIAA